MVTEAALAVVGVTVRFGGVCALEGVTLAVGPGEVLGLMGPNGAGKTTLFNVICGFVRPTSGHVERAGKPIRPVPHRLTRLGIARTVQGVGLWKGLTVVENVMTGARPRRPRHAGSRPWQADSRPWHAGSTPWQAGSRPWHAERALTNRARDLLGRLGLSAYADHLPATLPYGVQKRVALARALASEPSILVLDEPASGLSVDEVDDLAQRLGTLSKQMAILMVEHRVDLVMSVSHRVVVLDCGKVIATGSPEQVRTDPKVISAYLGESPAPRGEPCPAPLGQR